MERTKEQFMGVTVTEQWRVVNKRSLRPVIWCLLIAVLGVGCYHDTVDPGRSSDGSEQRLFILKNISPERGQTYLSKLGIDTVSSQSDPNALLVTCSWDNMHKVRVVLELADGEEEYVIEILAPVTPD